MRVVHAIDNLSSLPNAPYGLTIGSFDGVHIGHQALLDRLRKSGKTIVYTFSNHPSHVLSHTPTPLICTFEHKLKLLEQFHIDYVIAVPFTRKLAQIPYDVFLKELKSHLPFSHLVLGQGAVLGKNREGDADHIRALSPKLHFTIEYIPKLSEKNHAISSGHIRTLIANGDLLSVQHALGRPYSIYAPLHHHPDHFFLHTPELCLPPSGNYPVSILIDNTPFPGHVTIDRPAAHIRISCDAPLPPIVEIIFERHYH